MALQQETLEQIMDRMAVDDDFRTQLATRPYKALSELGLAADEIAEIRDATAGGDTLALGDRASAGLTTWGKLMIGVSGGEWCGCANKDGKVITAYCT